MFKIKINDSFVEYEYQIDRDDISIDDIAESIRKDFPSLSRGKMVDKDKYY
tara:strand:+ start:13029 stop:13181 length:153 start_codon:yes stop_codon:yes gene_type:complete